VGFVTKQVRKTVNRHFAENCTVVPTTLDEAPALERVEAVCEALNANFDAWFAETGGIGKWHEGVIHDPQFHRYYPAKAGNALYIGFGRTPNQISELKTKKTKGRHWLASAQWSEDGDSGRRVELQLIVWVNSGRNGKLFNKDRYEQLTTEVAKALAT
jgi:hypothetical protein